MIELIVLDVDGCLSDGKITYSSEIEEFKSFNVKDGLGIASWIRLGKKVAIITGRKSKIVEQRAKELRITHLHQGIKNKVEILEKILKQEKLNWDNVAVIGDDLNDLSMLKKASMSFTPQDGIEILKLHVDKILDKKGGYGAVREMIDIVIEKEGLKEEFIKLWL
ncbi:MAG: HAD-IIIA family hydrolase [Campylobacteraceae bacterium]|nr:HAD-IIIA family hydrolase [Campylobacteraceae bacterium]